jgi:hypothetical protein
VSTGEVTAFSNDSLGAEEARVAEKGVAFTKELGLRDLVLTQSAFVVGGSWVGTAAKLGNGQAAYWLLAIDLEELHFAKNKFAVEAGRKSMSTRLFRPVSS